MRRLLLAIALFASLPLAAATRYTIDIETTGDPLLPPHLHATVLADAAHRRIDVERKETPFTYDVLLSDDGGATWTALNTPLRTWFPLSAAALTGRAHVFNQWPLIGKNAQLEFRDIQVKTSDEPAEPLLGYAVQKHVIRTTFGMRQGRGAALLDVDFGSTAIVTTTDDIDPKLAVRAVTLITGIAPVDAKMEPAITAIKGFPLKASLSATRMFAGGRPQINTVTASVSDIRAVPAPAHAFERPAGYVRQEPIIGAPSK